MVEIRDAFSKQVQWGNTLLANPSNEKHTQNSAALLIKMGPQTWAYLSGQLQPKSLNATELQHLLLAADLSIRLEFYSELNQLEPFLEDAKTALLLQLNTPIPKTILAKFWQAHTPASPKTALYLLAPENIKRTVCNKYYGHLTSQIANLFDAGPAIPFEWSAADVYKCLNDEDAELIANWGNTEQLAIRAQMSSARAAEKVTASFYTALGCKVEDIAIRQTTGAGRDWATHDLLLDDKIPIDVKNARCPINNKMFYVEHTVPRFKRDRYATDVIIAGVLSPYLNFAFIENPDNAYFEIPPVRYIGETSRPAIESLTNAFRSSYLEIRSAADRTVAAWLFDFPDVWYRNFESRCNAIRNISDWPTREEFGFLYEDSSRVTVVPRLIAAGIPLPKFFNEFLESWQMQLAERLNSRSSPRITLPFLFLTLLSDFLERLREKPSTFSPDKYRDLLYITPPRQDRASAIHPVGIADPLGIIGDWIKTLAILWEHRDDVDLPSYNQFRFYGLGLLQGRRFESSHWDTILAYCGGWVYESSGSNEWDTDFDHRPRKKGKCGNSPLIVGREKLCGHCRKLICGECGFCSQFCEDQGLREFGFPATRFASSNFAEQRSDHEVSEEFGDLTPPSYLEESAPLEVYQDWAERQVKEE